jgi:hypothetical protein
LIPYWVKARVPPDGEEGAVGCNGSFAGPQLQLQKATGEAIEGLAREKRVDVESVFNMEQTESGGSASIKTTQGTIVTINAKKHQHWEGELDGTKKTCVWMKEVQ